MNTPYYQTTHPKFFSLVVDRALELVAQGETYLGMRNIMETCRQQEKVPVNNNDCVPLRKELIAAYPHLGPYFKVRKLSKSKHKKGSNYHFLQFIESLDCEVTQVTLRNDKGATYTLSKDQALRIKNKKVK